MTGSLKRRPSTIRRHEYPKRPREPTAALRGA
jgi:hypothetical protein